MSIVSCPVEDVTHTPGRLRGGMCQKHYQRFRKYGDPTLVNKRGGKHLPEPEDKECQGCGQSFQGGKARKYCTRECGSRCRSAERYKREFALGIAQEKARKRNKYADIFEYTARISRPSCSIESCERKHLAKGLCRNHYKAEFGKPEAKFDRVCENCGIEYQAGRAAHPTACRSCQARYPHLQRRRKAKSTKGSGRCRDCEATIDRQHIICDACSLSIDRSRRQASQHKRRASLRSAEYESFDIRSIYERDGWVCGLCGEGISQDRQYPDPLSVSLDHIIPISRGGSHTKENVQAAHLVCNIKKGASIPMEVAA